MVDETEALLQYFKVRRVLNMVSGVCFLVYILVFPALYFTLSNSEGDDISYILYAPLSVCLIIQIVCASLILHYRRKALRQIEMATISAYTNPGVANCPPGMTIAYQQPPGGGPLQPVFVLPSGSAQQFYNGANVASFPSVPNLHGAPPTYSQVMSSDQQPSNAPPKAGWAVPAEADAGTSSEGQPQPGH